MDQVIVFQDQRSEWQWRRVDSDYAEVFYSTTFFTTMSDAIADAVGHNAEPYVLLELFGNVVRRTHVGSLFADDDA